MHSIFYSSYSSTFFGGESVLDSDEELTLDELELYEEEEL